MDNVIKDMVPKPKSDEAMLAEMLTELQTLNKIAILKEEDFVIRKILRNGARSQILRDLQEKYPNEDIIKKDLDDFLLLYRDVLNSQKYDIEKHYVRRLMKSKEGLNNQLIDLAIQAKDMAKRYDNADDGATAVQALRTAADIFMKFAKVEGLATDMPEININMKMDKVVQNIANEKISSRLSDLETVDVGFKEHGNEDDK